MGAIFGKKKSTSTSNAYNQAYPYIQNTYSGGATTGLNALSLISSLLGVPVGPSSGGITTTPGSDTAGLAPGFQRVSNGDGSQGILPMQTGQGYQMPSMDGDAAYQKFLDSSGFQSQLNTGMRAITGSNAAKGLLNSGATLTALQQKGTDLAKQSFGDYLGQLFNVVQSGQQAGNLIGNAGQTTQQQSKSSEKPGLGGAIGSIGSAIAAGPKASDRRLKKDIKFIRKMDNGLNVYEYKYINDRGPYVGVMADEVARIVPEALGPVIDGYATVDYSKIGMI